MAINISAISSDTIKTLKRRLIAAIWRDSFFAIMVIGYTIRKGKIRTQDILTEEQLEAFQQGK